jgi:predicted transcriptional regulator
VVSVRQIKAARALLGWSQSDLAAESGISEPTIARLESVDGELGGRGATVQSISVALQKGGIQFIDENGGGPGVRLQKSTKHKR